MAITSVTRNEAAQRLHLVDSPTPLSEHPLLGERLGGIRLFFKRDDLGQIGGGGNKLRKLQLVLGKALESGADTVVTFGAVQSNHARLTAAAAAKLGIRCELILSRKVPRRDADYEHNGNQVLDRILGASIHVLSAEADPLAYCATLTEQLAARGRHCYVIPLGASDGLGALGYTQCLEELLEQAASMDVQLHHLVHASGSGGTQAGLLTGTIVQGSDVQVIGISVLHRAEQLRLIVGRLIKDACKLLDLSAPNETRVSVDDRFLGEGYGVPNAQVIEAIEIVARTEGVLLDPVYTGKAFAGLIALCREGRFKRGETVVFLHTGGVPGIFAYANEFPAMRKLN